MRKNIAMEQNGRSMIEMLGVLAIVGVLSVAGIAGYSKAMGKFKINKAMDQVSTLAANIKTMYASVGTYKTLCNDQAYKLSLFPDEMVRTCSGNNLTTKTSFIDFLIASAHAQDADDGQEDKDEIENKPDLTEDACIRNGINGTASVDGTDDDFTIQFTGISKEACSTFVGSEWGGASGFKGLTISGTDVAIAITASSSVSGMFNEAVKCNGCGNTGCTAKWTFY